MINNNYHHQYWKPCSVVLLMQSEQTVDHYLQYLKWREFIATKKSGFPPSRPIEEKLDYITSTEIYEALVKLPKGGNMHSHESK